MRQVEMVTTAAEYAECTRAAPTASLAAPASSWAEVRCERGLHTRRGGGLAHQEDPGGGARVGVVAQTSGNLQQSEHSKHGADRARNKTAIDVGTVRAVRVAVGAVAHAASQDSFGAAARPHATAASARARVRAVAVLMRSITHSFFSVGAQAQLLSHPTEGGGGAGVGASLRGLLKHSLPLRLSSAAHSSMSRSRGWRGKQASRGRGGSAALRRTEGKRTKVGSGGTHGARTGTQCGLNVWDRITGIRPRMLC